MDREKNRSSPAMPRKDLFGLTTSLTTEVVEARRR